MDIANQSSTTSLIIYLILLLLLSAFFSASETAMMSINRYRLKHLAKSDKLALRIQNLLAKIDRLLAVILIGNNFVNITASSLATLIGLKLYGDLGVVIATILLTSIILIFSEIMPKTFAANKPEPICRAAAWPLSILQIILFPVIATTNLFANGLLKLLSLPTQTNHDTISSDELRTILQEAYRVKPSALQLMLLKLLNLEKMTVNDIMVARTEIKGINLNEDINNIINTIRNSNHTLLPIYHGEINELRGIVHMRDLSKILSAPSFSKSKIISMAQKPYCVPTKTPLQNQLTSFQKQKKRLGMVVNEYGEILGLVTLEDILEEIIGEFTTNIAASNQEIIPQTDGSYLVDGSLNIRSINNRMNFEIPSHGAKTLSGAIIAYLEFIPNPATCVLLNKYPIEIIQMQDNTIKLCKILPRLP